MGGSPRQFRVPLGLHVQLRQKQKRRTKARAGIELDPIDLRLLRNPPSRAVVPYTPKNELEDSNLRFLIYHCKYHLIMENLMHRADKSDRRDGSISRKRHKRWSSIRMVPVSRQG